MNKSTYFIVKDSYGNFMRAFHTYQQASNYKFAYGNYSWTITQN